jgi:hypothetical protein
MQRLSLVSLMVAVIACGSDDDPQQTGTSSGSGASGGSSSGPGAGGGTGGDTWGFRIASPSTGSDVYGSANLVAEVSGFEPERVEFALAGSAEPACDDESAIFSCLIDLSLEETGSTHQIEARAVVDGETFASDSIELTKVSPEAPICKDAEGNDTPITDCLAALQGQGLATGNVGDFYDNMDGDHTTLNTANHPDVTYLHTAYGTQSIGSVPEHMDPGDALIGNASLCSTVGSECYGQLRWQISVGRADTLSQLYRQNKFFWFPEHTDHDDVDRADYMVPFTNNSQGSSGSEMDEVEKFLWTIAALSPEAKAAAITNGTLMPAVQMIFRRTRVASDTEYLSGKAHANAFDNVANDWTMVRWAQLLGAGDVPPVAELTVIEEDWDMTTGEVGFTTPVSIQRKWKGAIDTPRRMVVEAAAAGASTDATVSYHWRVLRGSADGVRITEQSADGARVEIEIDHHLEETVEVDGVPRLTKLVVIGAFVHDGRSFSAPSLVTSYAEM